MLGSFGVQKSPWREGMHVGSLLKNHLTDPPMEKYKHARALLMAVYLPCRGSTAKPFLKLCSLKASWRMVGSSQKGLVLQPCCHERNLSVEKIQLKCLRYLFCPFITQASPPSWGWEVRACVCVGLCFRGEPCCTGTCGPPPGSGPFIVLTINLSPIYNLKH